MNLNATTSLQTHHKRSKIRIDYILENKDVYTQHKYLRKWISSPFMVRMLQDMNFRRLLNHNQLEKEMTESYFVYKCVKLAISHLQTARESTFDIRNLVLFDICSGKGFTSCLLSFKFPDIQIYMVDKSKKMNLEHLKSLPNVKFENIDIKRTNMVQWTSERTQDKIGFVLGVHLCGTLAEIFVDTYNRNPAIYCMILSPCCLSKKNFSLHQLSQKVNLNNYDL